MNRRNLIAILGFVPLQAQAPTSQDSWNQNYRDFVRQLLKYNEMLWDGLNDRGQWKKVEKAFLKLMEKECK